MEQLGWLQIGQHQLQQDVTHGLAFVLVDGRDDELDFADLIGVLLLDGYGIFHVGLLPERYETMTDSPLVPKFGKGIARCPRWQRPRLQSVFLD